MITVEIENGEESCLRLAGHSGYAGKGSDIVCSAATILAYCFANAAIAMWKDDELDGEPEIKMESGDIEIRFAALPEYQATQQRITDAIEETYAQMERSYPECISLT